jgi:predicted nucleic acid-binding Zn ribbon protein
MRCVNCGTDLGESRSDRRTCSPRCRVALSRRLATRNAQQALNAYLAEGEVDGPLWDAYVKAAAKER